MNKLLSAAALAVALTLSGCASTGVQVTDDQIAQFKEGQTTKQQVIATLGQPTTTMRNSDGTTMLMYTYAEARTRASTFIPIVGMFTGGVDTRSNNVVLVKGQTDIV